MRLINADEIDVREVIGGASDFAQDIRDAVQRMIDRQPTIEAAPVVHAKWQEVGTIGVTTYSKGYSKCTACRAIIWGGWENNFCPNCGADMRTK